MALCRVGTFLFVGKRFFWKLRSTFFGLKKNFFRKPWSVFFLVQKKQLTCECAVAGGWGPCVLLEKVFLESSRRFTFFWRRFFWKAGLGCFFFFKKISSNEPVERGPFFLLEKVFLESCRSCVVVFFNWPHCANKVVTTLSPWLVCGWFSGVRPRMHYQFFIFIIFLC